MPLAVDQGASEPEPGTAILQQKADLRSVLSRRWECVPEIRRHRAWPIYLFSTGRAGGGSLTVESVPDAGSTFAFTCKLEIVAEPREQVAGPATDVVVQPLGILLADDNP